jgi:hypothetical protein
MTMAIDKPSSLHLVEAQPGALDLIWREYDDPRLWGALLLEHPHLVDHFLTGEFGRGSFADFLQRMLQTFFERKATGTDDRRPPRRLVDPPGSHAPLPLPVSADEPPAQSGLEPETPDKRRPH